ncbi:MULTISPECIES: lytic polysaccharide monooxygenase auxiliary activity family 9 protein [Streptomyces]|uniref:lytic polysaccharide monooxygenase auxiliary activity family 9 protein n=1 Tax=Streptomyces TaxID=1883 RepID=UPI0022496FF3|nr:lytic polysaccharide monooxygenase auxiliary activity family 9 protein [Streptomyces sp. JHD 1]MCX2970111.1 lytic polysaccharide monooxygenase [Streptomyces sp. JHD 1]
MNLAPATTSRRTALGATVLATSMLGLLAQAPAVSAHGTVIAPETRNYGCLQRWGSSEPDEAQDPMCYRTYHENPNAITAWKAVYANNTGDNYQQVIPDGQICSAGGQGETNYGALDRPGPWTTTSLDSDFTVDVYDEARHGADWLEIYVTKQGFDPQTQLIGWDDLELVKKTGSYPYQAHYTTDVSTSGYNGRHVVVTVWKASHMDQKYFLCSDVDFN